MSTQPAKQWKYLTRKPGSNYQQLFINGRIAARTIYGETFAADEYPGRTPEELAADFNLPLEAVLEAIEYCKSDPPEIRADYEMEQALMEASGMNDPNYKYHPTPKMVPPEVRAAIRRRFQL
jgi:uncharacterized protein (DUF433 family)